MLRALIALLVAAPLAFGASRECRDDLDEADGYTIRSVTVEGRWLPPLALPIHPGERFTNAKVQEAMRAVQRALHGEDRARFEMQNLGEVGVVHISRCLQVEDRQVDVIIRARAIRVGLFEVGQNVLPVPRAVLATFYDAVPAPLLALHPQLGAYQDKRYGFAPSGAIAADLLHLKPGAAGGPVASFSRLDLALSGRKSVDEPFYDLDLRLALRCLRPGAAIEEVQWTGAFNAASEPRGPEEFRRRSGELGGLVKWKPQSGGWQSVYLSGGYRYAENDFFDRQSRETSEHALALRVLGESRVGGGFLRAAFWGEAARAEGASDYGRVAGVLAYEKELLVAPNQTIGIEATLGGGHAWSAPAYARFYGGNSARNFLYDSPASQALLDFPTGPLLRSAGEGNASRAGVAGARSYWHGNLNVSLPIPRFSFPLIPNEEVAPGLTLKRLLKNKAGDSVAFYAAELEAEGLSPKEAMAKARQTYSEVQPAVDYIADRANAYALKPLFLCDVAGLDGEQVQATVGGGLQLTIVTARMELGYMQAVSGARAGSGNFFGRIVFENIF